VALDGLAFSYRLDRRGGGRWHLTGKLAAHVVQTCVVSLEPVAASVDVPVEVEFWPQALVDDLAWRDADEGGTQGLLDWPEPIMDGRIDLGPVIYETLATSLDPYPKRDGVSFDWSQGPAEDAGQAKTGPFAALAALKRR
jgi:uncharacterized metal-binding protein YceD (DUF177 family)